MKKAKLILIGVLCWLFIGCSCSPNSELHTVAIEYSNGSKDTLELKLFTNRINERNYDLVTSDMAYPYLIYDDGDCGEIYNVVRVEILK